MPDGSDLRRVNAYFIADQSPDYLDPPVLGRCAPLLDKVPDNRQYIDVGDSVTFNLNGAQVTANRELDALDFDGVVRHDIIYKGQTTEPTEPGFFDSRLGAEIGIDMPFADVLDNQLYMPPKPTMTSHSGSEVAIKRGEDLVLEWEYDTPVDPNITTAGIIAFISPGGGDPILCVTTNTGRFVVPAETIEEFPGNGGIMQVGAGSNEAVLTDDGRIIHMWGSSCQFKTYTVVD